MGRRALFGVVAFSSLVVGGIFACGQGANGTDACQSIEHARCQWIVQCYPDAANYGLPTRRSDTSSPVDDCFRYYDDACLHGLVSNVSTTTLEVNACVNAINGATDCTIVQNPQTADACAFLSFDASTDADGE